MVRNPDVVGLGPGEHRRRDFSLDDFFAVIALDVVGFQLVQVDHALVLVFETDGKPLICLKISSIKMCPTRDSTSPRETKRPLRKVPGGPGRPGPEVYDIDAERCPQCGGKVRPVGAVTDPMEAQRFLDSFVGSIHVRGPPHQLAFPFSAMSA